MKVKTILRSLAFCVYVNFAFFGLAHAVMPMPPEHESLMKENASYATGFEIYEEAYKKAQSTLTSERFAQLQETLKTSMFSAVQEDLQESYSLASAWDRAYYTANETLESEITRALILKNAEEFEGVYAFQSPVYSGELLIAGNDSGSSYDIYVTVAKKNDSHASESRKIDGFIDDDGIMIVGGDGYNMPHEAFTITFDGDKITIVSTPEFKKQGEFLYDISPEGTWIRVTK